MVTKNVAITNAKFNRNVLNVAKYTPFGQISKCKLCQHDCMIFADSVTIFINDIFCKAIHIM